MPINTAIHAKIASAISEDNLILKEREAAIWAAYVALISNQHFLMLGPAGSAKTMLSRRVFEHIDDVVYFETQFNEETTSDQVSGAPDIKALVDQGVTRRVMTGMLPEATHAMLDEFFNGNKLVLHDIMPLLNERVIQYEGQAHPVPLRSAFMGTNKLTLDPDLAAVWDRIPIRLLIDYVRSRQNKSALVAEAVARRLQKGRGIATAVDLFPTTKVTLADLDLATSEALGLDVDDKVMPLMWDIEDELLGNGIVVGTRREVEGMFAVMANAWLRGHDTVQTMDLDILQHMWWITQDQIETAQKIILAATVPSEKMAIDLLEEMEEARVELAQVAANDSIDDLRKMKQKSSTFLRVQAIIREANEGIAKAQAAGTSTDRLTKALTVAQAMESSLSMDIFGLPVPVSA